MENVHEDLSSRFCQDLKDGCALLSCGSKKGGKSTLLAFHYADLQNVKSFHMQDVERILVGIISERSEVNLVNEIPKFKVNGGVSHNSSHKYKRYIS